MNHETSIVRALSTDLLKVEHYLLDGNGIGLLGERFANLGKVAIVVIFITDLKKIVSHEALNFQA